MPTTDALDEEHELPAAEAVLAGTLALMTGYGQALLADGCPGQRLMMGRKIERNLALLASHPTLSDPFRRILVRLRESWCSMDDCTAGAAADIAPGVTFDAPRMLQ